MQQKMSSTDRWKYWGIAWIILCGFILHFLYIPATESRIVGFFAPVNESVWEHLKLGYWSVALLALAEYPKLKSKTHNYFPAKIAGMVTLQLTVLIVFYGYRLITKSNFFFLDILSYILGAIFCQILAFRIMKRLPMTKTINTLCLVVFLAIGLLLGISTYYPPHLSIFKDHNNNTYGISKE